MRRVCDIVVLAALAVSAFASAQGPSASILAKGQAALTAGKAAEALRLGDAFVLKEPKRYEGHRLVARAALLLDRPDRAEKAFKEALRLAPPVARPALQNGLRETASLRQGLQSAARARTLKASGDLAAAARAQEAAYRALPARYALGLAAAEMYESADRLDDARRMLEDVRASHPKANAVTHVTQRLASLQVRIDAARRASAEESARKRADEAQTAENQRLEGRRAEEARRLEGERQTTEEARRAKEAERKRLDAEEAQRRAEDERQRAEKARLDQEEIARLTTILDGHKRAVGEAEGAITEADGRVGDFERAVRRFDSEVDNARDRRDGAKRERDDLQSKLDDAKGDLSKQLLRDQLRTAESKYDDAKGDYNRARDRYNDAKSSLEQWRNTLNEARGRLEQARQGVRDTEAAIARVG